MRAGRRRRPVLLLTVAGVLCLAGTAWATDATLTGGEGSSWGVTDTAITSNGQPQGGDCGFEEFGSGATTFDAQFDEPLQGDAFDNATMLWVNGQLVGGALTATPNEANTTNEASFASADITDLSVSLRYYVLPDQATMRVLLRLSNDNAVGGPIGAAVEYVNNFGSDNATVITASSTGNATHTMSDRWIITEDGDGSGGDPANTSVFFGPGNPAETPFAVSNGVFNCAGTEGSYERFELEIPQNASQTLMFFQQINPTDGEAVTDAAQYDTTPALGNPLVAGLTQADLDEIVNWDYGNATPAECSDGADNDGDGRIDHPADRQCESPSDPSERTQCSDSLDNDGDGRVDYPADPGCQSVRDNSESPNPQCSDNVDNDGDGDMDHPADPGCSGPRDNNEANAACADTVDNDGDGRTDYPADAGCSSRTDNSESPDPQCGDGGDNDGDTRTDYPADPGCTSIRDNSESPDPQCGDNADNDGDGRTDYPADPGCMSIRDNSESPDPQCGDFADNDGDGRTDYPADPGCRSARDTTENTDSPPADT